MNEKLTVAELKRRLQVGTKLRLVHSLLGPCNKDRIVAGQNTANVWFTGTGIKPNAASYLNWPKAKDLIETSTGFEILEDGKVAARYEWADPCEGRECGGTCDIGGCPGNGTDPDPYAVKMAPLVDALTALKDRSSSK
jgi:hypothetical protein